MKEHILLFWSYKVVTSINPVHSLLTLTNIWLSIRTIGKRVWLYAHDSSSVWTDQRPSNQTAYQAGQRAIRAGGFFFVHLHSFNPEISATLVYTWRVDTRWSQTNRRAPILTIQALLFSSKYPFSSKKIFYMTNHIKFLDIYIEH